MSVYEQTYLFLTTEEKKLAQFAISYLIPFDSNDLEKIEYLCKINHEFLVMFYMFAGGFMFWSDMWNVTV